MEDLNSHRDELLARFRESIGKPMSERFFDEDDLLDIFDYAGDINDDYLRLEALLCAARYYPDNEYFLERKAIFYTQNSAAMRDRFLEDNSNLEGMIFELLKVDSIILDQPEKARVMLDKIVDKYDDFTDEETIQLIAVAASFGNTDWYKQNLDKLRKKTYLNILLYEIAVNAESLGDLDLSVEMMEKLTELEPFNINFWMFLSREYAGLENAEKATQAIEYALAIDPENPEARYIRARILFAQDSRSEGVLSTMESVVADEPESYEYAKFLSAIYAEYGMTDKAAKPLIDYYNRHKESAYSIIPDIVQYNPLETDRLLDEFYRLNPDTTTIFWTSWAQQMVLIGNIGLAKKIVEAFARNSGGEEIMEFFNLVNIFLEKRFAETLEQIQKYLSRAKYSDTEFPVLVVINLVSQLRLGKLEEAKRFCRFILEATFNDNPGTLVQRIELIGMRNLIDQIASRLDESSDASDWDDFDPLHIWDNNDSQQFAQRSNDSLLY